MQNELNSSSSGARREGKRRIFICSSSQTVHPKMVYVATGADVVYYKTTSDGTIFVIKYHGSKEKQHSTVSRCINRLDNSLMVARGTQTTFFRSINEDDGLIGSKVRSFDRDGRKVDPLYRQIFDASDTPLEDVSVWNQDNEDEAGSGEASMADPPSCVGEESTWSVAAASSQEYESPVNQHSERDLMISMIRDQRALMEETSRALLDAAAQIGSLGEESHLCQHRMSGMSSELAELNRRLVGVNAELAALRSKLELVAREKASALVSLEEKDATIAELRSANETLKADLAAAGASPPSASSSSASSRVAVTASAPIRPSLSLQRLGRANDSAWAMIVTDDSPREDLMLKIRAMEQHISDLSRTANINADVGDSYKEELEGLYLRLKRLESPEAADVGTFKSVVSIMNAAASALDPRAGGDAGWDRQGCEEVVRKLVEGLVSSVAPQRASRSARGGDGGGHPRAQAGCDDMAAQIMLPIQRLCEGLIEQRRMRAANERLVDDLAAGGCAPASSGGGNKRPKRSRSEIEARDLYTWGL